jgi:hypothetical protein
MHIEILTFEGCPHAGATLELVKEAVRSEAVDAEIEFVEVGTPDLAQRLRFLGSPSVRIDGEDVEWPANDRTAYGLMCRTYLGGREVAGTPSIAMIRAAIRRRVASRDILSNRTLAFGLFWFPALILVASGFIDLGQTWRTVVWVIVLTTIGSACVANAMRCGRVHCYATGPFFLVMAIVALVYGLGLVPLGKHGWNTIGLAVLVGAIALCSLPEAFLGKYRGRAAGRS